MPRALRLVFVSLVLLVGACLSPPEGVPVTGPFPPPAPGMARLVFYRTLAYYDSLAQTPVYLNGQTVGVSQNGAVFYRDVVPGPYEITVFSPGAYPNQFKTVVPRAGEVFYVRIDTLPKPPCTRFPGAICYDDTFIVTLVDPMTGFQQVQGTRLISG
jgi:hypothetical protein